MPLSDVRDYFITAVQSLPYSKSTLRARVEMNHPLQSLEDDAFSGTPDLSLLLSAVEQSSSALVPILAECAFTQDRNDLWKKLQNEIKVHPELVIVLVIMITEKPEYHSPPDESNAWNLFVKEDRCRTCGHFLELQKGDFVGGEPPSIRVEVAGHTWCNITSAECFVWVKDDRGKIDVNHEHSAHGVSRTLANLFPC
jgi:hypothetical protein